MEKFFIYLLVLSFIEPVTRIHSQDEYMLKDIRELLSETDQKRIEKAEKYLASGDDKMKESIVLEDVGKNKNKSINKKIGAATDYGSAHKIIYEVYLENVQKQSKATNFENASKQMKEAKKKREASLRINNVEKAYELVKQSLDLEKKAINFLAENYIISTGVIKKKDDIVKIDPNKNLNKQVVNKEPDDLKKESIKKDEIKKTEESKFDNAKTIENEIVKKDNVVKNNEIKEDEESELNKNIKQERKGVFYKIQIAASKTPLSVEQLNAIYKTNEIFNVDKDGEWYKYSISEKFKTYDAAFAYKENLRIKGIFIIAFKDGKKVTLEEALRKDDEKKDVVENKKEETIDIKTNQEVKTIFRLQIGISTKPMSDVEISQFKNGGKPVTTVDNGGWYSYNVGEFNTEKDALNFKKSKGLTDAIVVKFVNGILVEE